MYFDKFPSILYPYEINGEMVYKQVTDITINVRITKAILQYVTSYDEYDMKEGETPEIVAERAYGSPLYHWVVMICNDRYDYLDDFPLPQYELEQYIINKYGSWAKAQETHHYIDANGFTVSAPLVTATNIVADELYKIEYSGNTNFTLIGAANNDVGTIFTATGPGTGTGVVIPEAPIIPYPVSNYQYEVDVNESKRRIKLISSQNLFMILGQFKSLI